MPFDDLLAEAGSRFSEAGGLFAEAQRQLNICNSCRYCAGYCPVWPALELRTELRREDVTYLASLCHDCQACLTACMYSPPHEFGVNPPQLFSQVRDDTYRRYVWPARPAPARTGRRRLLAGLAAAGVLLTALALLTGTGAIFSGSSPRSPYELLPHLVLVIVVLLPTIFAAVIMARAAWRYWQDIDGRIRALADLRAWARTFWQAATLRHQTGGQEGCSDPGAEPDTEPSAARRRYHHLVAYGFLLTFASTVAAWVTQTFLHDNPPYSLISVPVLTGTIGGIAASAGCAGLIVLRRRAHRAQPAARTQTADYAMIWSLLALMLTGLAVLATRTTPLFAPALVVHLAAVIVAVTIAPYTRFFHWAYRLLSIQHSNLEQRSRQEAGHLTRRPDSTASDRRAPGGQRT